MTRHPVARTFNGARALALALATATAAGCQVVPLADAPAVSPPPAASDAPRAVKGAARGIPSDRRARMHEDGRAMTVARPAPAPMPEPWPEPWIEPMPEPWPEPWPRHAAEARRGVVTAGDIDDTLNLAAFRVWQARAAQATGLPRAAPARVFSARLVGPDGRAAPGVAVTLRRPGAAEPFWSGISGVDGRITIFPAIHGAAGLRRAELRAFGAGQSLRAALLTRDRPARVALPFAGEWRPQFLDLVFVFDTTGSMGDELAWLTREFAGIVAAARRAAPGVDIRFGLIAYRDRGDRYVVRDFGFTGRQARMQGWLRELRANGGGDYPEAAAAAMAAAARLDWRRGRGDRLLFHVADAPAHRREARAYLDAAARLARKNVQVFGLGASGVGPEAEFLMRQAAATTQGRYLFLTDDSGVGLRHEEPAIACYRVTKLKSLLTRVLRSELTGHRQEARPGEVIRTVGTYRDGICLQ